MSAPTTGPAAAPSPGPAGGPHGDPTAEAEQLRRRLAESEDRLRAVLERNADGVVIVDEDGIVRLVNPAAAALFDKRPDELVGRNFGFPLVTRELVEIDVLANASAPTVAEMRVAAITWDERPAFLASLRDITERLRAEEQLRRKEEELEAAQRLEAVGRFAAAVTSGMNDVLMGVSGISRVALRKLSPLSPAYSLVEEILKASEDGALVVRRLALLGAPRAAPATPVDVNAVVTSLAPLARRIVGRGREITLDLGPALWRALASEPRVEQIIANLVLAARDASPRGGAITVRTRNVALGPAEEPFRDPIESGSYVLLEIGVGAEGGGGERFEPLFTDGAEPAGGAGGLGAVRSLVEEHGGHLKVRGAGGGGVGYLAYLPRASGPTTGAGPGGARERRSPGGTVLVVDDEPLLRLALRGALELAGYRVLEADGAERARELGGRPEEGVRALVTSVRLPGRSGLELGRQLAEGRPGLGIVYMADFGESASVRARLGDERATLLEKPFAPEAAVEALDAILASPADHAAAPNDAGGGATILLVEEDDTARGALASLLAYHGHRVITARTADEALSHARARAGAIDLLLTELALPGSSTHGDELAHAILGIAPRARVIFVSGYPEELAASRFRLPAGAEYLEKPVEVETLERRIEALRGRAEA